MVLFFGLDALGKRGDTEFLGEVYDILELSRNVQSENTQNLG